MALYVHHAARLGALADVAADVLAAPLADPFTAEVIAVPTAGVRDFLLRRLAERLGVAANVELPFPGRLIATALGDDTDPDGNPWEVARLTWAVLAVLERGDVDAPGWPAASGQPRLPRYAVARRLADLLDRYASNRPQLIQQWGSGAPGDGTVTGAESLVGRLDGGFEWQFHLWRAVRELIGVPSTAERLPELSAALRRGELDPSLPPRVGWFGFNGIAAAHLDVLDALAAQRDVHVFAAHPSPVRWRRAPTLHAGTLVHRRRFEESLQLSRDAAEQPAEGHPLVRSWGRPAVELAALVRGIGAATAALDGAADEADVPNQPAPTLLRHVQRDVIADRPPSPFPHDADGSIQVHACHGVTRQLEVLRDVLGDIFVADPTLQPHDVLVLCPEIERFEPFAEAVFARGTLPVPLMVTDLSLRSVNPVAAALVAVLRATRHRCTAIDVLDLATLDPVRRRLGLTIDDVDRVSDWIGVLGTSWGIDAEHRAGVLARDGSDPSSPDVLTAGTWDATLRAMLVGAAMPSPEPRAVTLPGDGVVVPFDDMSRDAVDTAGRLAELVARLRRVRTLLRGTRRPAEWCDVLVDVLALLCAADPDDAFQMGAITGAIDEVRTAAATGPAADVELGADDAIALVDDLVRGRRGRLRLRTGAVTMTGLVPMRNVPARVLCLLGFDETSLRPPGVDGDDVLGVQPCVGEPDRRADRRQFVLDALLAAGDHFIVLCDGSDITTNRRVHFAVQLGELLDTLDRTLAVSQAGNDADAADSPVVRRHPLRAYDERNLRAGDERNLRAGDQQPWTFDDAMLRAATARRAAAEADATVPGVQRRWALPATPSDASERVTLDQLVEACTRPARTLLRDALDVRLPGEVDEFDTNIPLAVSSLEAASLGRRLLDGYRAGAGGALPDGATFEEVQPAVLAAWRDAERLAGRVPPGQLVDRSLDDVAREVDQLVAKACDVAAGLDRLAVLGAVGEVVVEVALAPDGAPPESETVLADTVTGIADAGQRGRAICHLSYTRPKARTYVASALALAACVVTTGQTDWFAINATRGEGSSRGPKCELLGVTGDVGDAQRLLDVAATLRVAARSTALPLFEEASRELYAEGHLDDETLRGGGFKRGDLADPDTGFVWGTTTTADILRLEPARHARLLWGAVDDFVSTLSETTRPAHSPKRAGR